MGCKLAVRLIKLLNDFLGAIVRPMLNYISRWDVGSRFYTCVYGEVIHLKGFWLETSQIICLQDTVEPVLALEGNPRFRTHPHEYQPRPVVVAALPLKRRRLMRKTQPPRLVPDTWLAVCPPFVAKYKICGRRRSS